MKKKHCPKCNQYNEFYNGCTYCKKCESRRAKEYRQQNKNKLSKRRKRYREVNKEKLKKQKHEHYLRHKDKIKEKRKIYMRKRRSDLTFKLKDNISKIVHHVLRNNKGGQSVLEYLPYTMDELKNHIESQFEDWMSWDNWGVYSEWSDDNPDTWTWQIDHIIPQSKLPYDSMDHPNFQRCWALENLRPLSSKDNIKKGNKMCA